MALEAPLSGRDALDGLIHLQRLFHRNQPVQNRARSCTQTRSQNQHQDCLVVLPSVLRYGNASTAPRRTRWPHQQKRGTTVPDLNERIVDVSGENTVSQEPAPKPPLNAPAPQSVSQQIVQNVTQLCPMPAITQPRDPVRMQQWAKPSIPQTALHLPNVVKPSGNSLQPIPTPQPIQAPARGSISVSADPTSVASGGAVVLTVSASGGKSVRLSGQYLNGSQGPKSVGVWTLPATGGTQSSGALNLPPNTSVTFTAVLSGAGGGGSSLPTTVQGSCAVRIT